MGAQAKSSHWRGRPGGAVTDATNYDEFPADSTGSDAEYYAALEADVRLKALHGDRFKGGPTIEVPGIFEAVTHVTFSDPRPGHLPVYLKGPQGSRGRDLGTLVAEGHPWLKARPDLFRKLYLPVDEPWPPVAADDERGT